MDPVIAINRLGGAARADDLRPLVTQAALEKAVSGDMVTRPFPGTFALSHTPVSVAAAVHFAGFVSHTSAADLWGCELLRPFNRHHITVPRRSGKPVRVDGVVLHHDDLGPEDSWSRPLPLTSLTRTIIDCARTLPLADAVVIGDSALRLGDVRLGGTCDGVTAGTLRTAAEALDGPDAHKVGHVLDLMDAKAGSLLESVFRVLVHLAGLPPPETQVRLLDGDIRVDFYWPGARVVVEVEGYEFHSGRAAWSRDCRRHNRLVAGEYRLLRFSWDDIKYGHPYVVETLKAALSLTGAAAA